MSSQSQLPMEEPENINHITTKQIIHAFNETGWFQSFEEQDVKTQAELIYSLLCKVDFKHNGKALTGPAEKEIRMAALELSASIQNLFRFRMTYKEKNAFNDSLEWFIATKFMNPGFFTQTSDRVNAYHYRFVEVLREHIQRRIDFLAEANCADTAQYDKEGDSVG